MVFPNSHKKLPVIKNSLHYLTNFVGNKYDFSPNCNLHYLATICNLHCVFKQKKNSSQEDELVVQTLQSKFCDRMDRIICGFLCLSSCKDIPEIHAENQEKCSLKNYTLSQSSYLSQKISFFIVKFCTLKSENMVLLFPNHVSKDIWTVNFRAKNQHSYLHGLENDRVTSNIFPKCWQFQCVHIF